MRRVFPLLPFVLLMLVTASAPSLYAQSTVPEAISYISDPGHQPKRAEARAFLVQQGPEVVPVVVEVLNSNHDIARVNAALVLFDFMDAAGVAVIKPHMIRCLGDSSAAVRYVGLTGALKLGLAEGALTPILKKALEPDAPLPMACLAAETAAKQRLTPLVPWVYRLVHSLVPHLTYSINAANREMALSIVKSRERADRPGEGPDAGGRPDHQPPPQETQPPEGPDEVREEKKITFEADKATRTQLRQYARLLEKDATVAALRNAGKALEMLAAKKFGFTPKEGDDDVGPLAAWKLSEAVKRAGTWYEQNKQNYPPLEIKPHPTPTTAEKPAEKAAPGRTGGRRSSAPPGPRTPRRRTRGGPPPP